MALNVKPSMTETWRKIRNNDKIFHFTPDKSLLKTATEDKPELWLAAGKWLCLDGNVKRRLMGNLLIAAQASRVHSLSWG